MHELPALWTGMGRIRPEPLLSSSHWLIVSHVTNLSRARSRHCRRSTDRECTAHCPILFATFCQGPCECQSNVHRCAGFVCTTASRKEDRTQGRFVVAISRGRGNGT